MCGTPALGVALGWLARFSPMHIVKGAHLTFALSHFRTFARRRFCDRNCLQPFASRSLWPCLYVPMASSAEVVNFGDFERCHVSFCPAGAVLGCTWWILVVFQHVSLSQAHFRRVVLSVDTFHSAPRTPRTSLYIPHTPHFTFPLYTLHFTHFISHPPHYIYIYIYTLHSVLTTAHSPLYTTLHTLHPTLLTLHSSFRTLHFRL